MINNFSNLNYSSDYKTFKKDFDITSSQITDIIEKTDVGTWVWDIETDEMKLSERCLEILGYQEQGLEKTTREFLLGTLHHEDLEETKSILRRHFEGEYPYYRRENRYKHKEGHFVWVVERGYVVERDSQGIPLLMFGTYADITKRKQIEYALENYIDTLNHDLRSPLSVILGYSSFLLEEDLSPEEIKKFAGIINVTGKKMLKMMESYLSLAKIERGQNVVDKNPIMIAQIINELKNYFVHLNKQDIIEINLEDLEGISVSIDLIEKNILIDENLFYSLTHNLIHNALEASSKIEDKIIINIFEDKKYLYLSFLNKGEIPTHIQKKLFKKFISSKKNGNGVGLYSARLIARAHGGDISYQSVKGGTRFLLKIPFE